MICMHRLMSVVRSLYGEIPVANWRRTQPNDQMSTFRVRCPFSCSGGMYLGVPWPAALVALVSSSLEDSEIYEL